MKSDGRSDEARITLLQVDEMTEEQRAFHQEVVDGPRGQIIGPLRAAMHSPELARRWSAFGEYVRYKTCLPGSLSELAILVCARRYNCRFEWAAHSAEAARQDLPRPIIEAIGRGIAPRFRDRSEYLVYEYARVLHMTGTVPPDLHRDVVAELGQTGIIELTALIGYYTMVAMTLNAHELPIPDNLKDDMVVGDELFSLHEGAIEA